MFLFFCVRHLIQTFLRWWFNNCWFHTQFVSLLYILLWNWSLQINFHITCVQSEAENLFTWIYVHIRSDEATGWDCFLFLLWLCAHFFSLQASVVYLRKREKEMEQSLAPHQSSSNRLHLIHSTCRRVFQPGEQPVFCCKIEWSGSISWIITAHFKVLLASLLGGLKHFFTLNCSSLLHGSFNSFVFISGFQQCFEIYFNVIERWQKHFYSI